MPDREVIGAITAPVADLVETSVHHPGPLRVRAAGRVQRLQVRLGERPPHIRRGQQPGERNGEGCLLLRPPDRNRGGSTRSRPPGG